MQEEQGALLGREGVDVHISTVFWAKRTVVAEGWVGRDRTRLTLGCLRGYPVERGPSPCRDITPATMCCSSAVRHRGHQSHLKIGRTPSSCFPAVKEVCLHVRHKCAVPNCCSRCQLSWVSTFLFMFLFICGYRSSHGQPSVSRGTHRYFKGCCRCCYHLGCK